MKFGKDTTRKALLGNAQGMRKLRQDELDGVCNGVEKAVREMQKEEATHSAHWAKDAENLGITYDQLQNALVVPGVQALIDSAYTDSLAAFFSVLAGTEYIAEELGTPSS